MASRKKIKSKTKKKTKVKKKKTAVRRPAPKKTVKSKVKKKPKKKLKKKVASRRTTPKKKPAAKKKPTIRKPPTPKPAIAATVPLAGVQRIGVVTHYYSHLTVAIVQMETGSLREGDTIHIKGHTSDFRQRVGSMEIDHVHVPQVFAGQVFGMKVTEHAREHDVVYKVASP
jgi:hypothetical protein